MNEREFSEIVKALCKHPTIYTPNGTFSEVSIFLEGFALGAQVGGLKHRAYHSKFSPFFQWLAARQGQQYVGGGWKNFRDSYSSEAAALTELAEMYREYAETECNSKSNLEGRG